MQSDFKLALRMQKDEEELLTSESVEDDAELDENGFYKDPKMPALRRRKRARTETPPTPDVARADVQSSFLKLESVKDLINERATANEKKLNSLKEYLSGDMDGRSVYWITAKCGTKMIRDALLLGHMECERLHKMIQGRFDEAKKKLLFINYDRWEEQDLKFFMDAIEARSKFANFDRKQLVTQMTIVRREIVWLKDGRDDLFQMLDGPCPEEEEYEFSPRNDANEDRSNMYRRKSLASLQDHGQTLEERDDMYREEKRARRREQLAAYPKPTYEQPAVELSEEERREAGRAYEQAAKRQGLI